MTVSCAHRTEAKKEKINVDKDDQLSFINKNARNNNIKDNNAKCEWQTVAKNKNRAQRKESKVATIKSICNALQNDDDDVECASNAEDKKENQ